MEEKNEFLKKEEYEEPACPLCRTPEIRRIPTDRVISKLDSYLGRNDYSSAERHLKYWLAEATDGGDDRGRLTILNEQIGLYRKTGKKAEGLETILRALELSESDEFSGTVTVGTTYINAATGYKAFSMPEEALPLYKKAQKIYEEQLEPEDERLGGLYNNMALTVMSLGGYAEARVYFERALEIMSRKTHGEPEMAITCLNLATLTEAEKGLEDGEAEIGEYLDRAEELLDTPDIPQDGNYAFVCEKCAGVFGYYGRFITEQTIRERSNKIYERS